MQTEETSTKLQDVVPIAESLKGKWQSNTRQIFDLFEAYDFRLEMNERKKTTTTKNARGETRSSDCNLYTIKMFLSVFDC